MTSGSYTPITTLLYHLHALENALPSDRLVLWPEPQPDAGVDWCVELRAGGRYTGCGLTSRQKMRTSPESPVKVKKEKLQSTRIRQISDTPGTSSILSVMPGGLNAMR